MEMPEGYLTKNFKIKEFACPCCGVSDMKLAFVEELQYLRAELGSPMKVNSGFRCKKHNEKVGGSEDSSHLRGMASDISVTNSLLRYRMVQCAQSIGIMRIGIGDDFIHFDTDYMKTNPVIWTY